MTRKKKLQLIYDRLFGEYGECVCPLVHETPFQLLSAVMLSAQCKDERVNLVTRVLFSLAPDAASMASLPVETIEKIIHPCGLSVAKSRNLKAAAERIVSVYGGEVPRTMEDLVTLPGIGRKSANVVLGNAFNIPGFPVDTHVNRLLNRIGMTASANPEVIEREVNKDLAPEYWSNFSHLLITHGRRVCTARRAGCGECVLNDICKFAGK